MPLQLLEIKTGTTFYLVPIITFLYLYCLGHTASFDELPLSIAIYTTSHVVGDVVHTVLFSGVPALERSTYVTLEAKISPDDGHLKWDSTTSK